MSARAWTQLPDDEFDAAMRSEMAGLAANNPAPPLRATTPPARRRWLPAPSPDRPRRTAPLALATALAVVAVAGGGAWIGMHRLHGRANLPAAPASPTPLPTATPWPTDTPSPPPPTAMPALVSTVHTSAPVFYYSTYGGQPSAALRLQAMDWSGALQGYIDLPGESIPSDGSTFENIRQSPDGQRLLVGSWVYAADGRHLYDLGDVHSSMWADDGRHVCGLSTKQDPATSGTISQVDVYGDGGTVEHSVPMPHETGGDSAYQLAACSVIHDRVALYTSVCCGLRYVTTLQISTGRVLSEQDLCPNNCTRPVISTATTPDARFSAEGGPVSVQVRSLLDGKVRMLREQGDVIALSADASRLLISPGTGLELIDVASDRVLWSTRIADDAGRSRVIVAPSGGAIAVALADHPAAQTSPAPTSARPLPVPAHITLLLGSGPALRIQTTAAADVYSLWGWQP